MSFHKVLGKGFAALQTRCFTRRPGGAQTLLLESIDDSSDSRPFRTDYGQVNVLGNDQVEKPVDVLSINGDIFGKLCGSRVTRCTVELLELGILLDFPGDGMFPATGTDEKYFQCNRAVLSSWSSLLF